MARSPDPTDFFLEFLRCIYMVPKKGIAIAVALGVTEAATDLVLRSVSGADYALAYIVPVATIVASVVAVYLIAMMILKRPATLAGGSLFAATSLAIGGIPLALLFVGPWLQDFGGSAIFIIIIAVLFFGLPLLSGWPITQAIAGRFIAPSRVLQATSGYRVGLFAANFLNAIVSKALPATDHVVNDSQVIVLAAANGAVTFANLVLLASISVTAWRFAIQQDPELAVKNDLDSN